MNFFRYSYFTLQGRTGIKFLVALDMKALGDPGGHTQEDGSVLTVAS